MPNTTPCPGDVTTCGWKDTTAALPLAGGIDKLEGAA
jgi:hypothetical protein